MTSSGLIATAVCALSGFVWTGCASSAPTPPTPRSHGAIASRTTAHALELGTPAPDFELTDLEGNVHKLSRHRGQIVVLEWFSPACLFTTRSHEQGPLKDQARRAMARGVVWLSVNSTAPRYDGHGVEANAKAKAAWAMPNPILLDPSGDVGRAYGVTATPQMFVIDPRGTVVYVGAIDNDPDIGDPRGDVLENYVDLALADLAAGRPVARPNVPTYGCRVKYDRP